MIGYYLPSEFNIPYQLQLQQTLKKNYNSASLQIKLLLLTVILAIAGFTLISQLSDKSSYVDDTTQFRVFELQEFNGDTELPLDNQSALKEFILNLLLAYITVFLLNYVCAENLSSNLHLLHQSRPRSPPSY